jgi:hypothetical protein
VRVLMWPPSGSRFLLRPTDGRARVWRQRNTSFQDHILGTTAFGDGGVTVRGCISFDCKLDLYILACQLTHDCRNGGLRVERAHCHGIFGLSDYHQECTSPTYSQRKNNPRQLHNPKCQNIDELRTAILQEWQQFPPERLRRLVRSMTRRVTELHNKRGGYFTSILLKY